MLRSLRMNRMMLSLVILAALAPSLGADFISWDHGAGTSAWSNPQNWTFDQLPGFGDDVNIGGYFPFAVVNLDIPGTTQIANFTLMNDSTLSTSGGELVTEDAYLLGAGTRLYAPVNSLSPLFDSLDVNSLTINSGAELVLQDGRVEVDNGIMTINTNSLVTGYGQIDFEYLPGTTVVLDNNGIIRGGRPSPGVFNQVYIMYLDSLHANARVALDGYLTSNGRIELPDGTGIDLDIPLLGEYNSTITMGANTILDIGAPWTLGGVGGGGVMDVDAASTIPLVPDVALIAGGEVTVSGNSRINVDTGTLRFNAPTTVETGAIIDLDEGVTLRWHNPATIEDPNSIVNDAAGTRFNVYSTVFIGSGFGSLDWDNVAGDGTTIVNANSAWIVNVGSLDAGADTYAGRIELNSGGMSIQVADGAWTMNGELEMNNTALDRPILAGSRMVVSQIGSINMTGDCWITADLDLQGDLTLYSGVGTLSGRTAFRGTSQVSLSPGTILKLNYLTEYSGGSYTGNGEMQQNGPAHVTGSTTIDVERFNFDGALNTTNTIIDPAATFQLNVSYLDDVSGVTHNGSVDISDTGTLAVQTAAEWGMGPGGELRLHGSAVPVPAAVVSGADFATESSGRVEGNGRFATNVRNAGIFEPGEPVGNILVQGNYLQSVLGNLNMDLGGTTAIVEHDQLNVAGEAHLDGNLSLSTYGGYVDPIAPGTVDEFVLVIAGTVYHDFATIFYDGTQLVPEFGVGPDGDFTDHIAAGLFRIMDYTATSVRLLNYKALPGDANGDGMVDGQDFLIWNAHKFTAGTDWLTGDFTGDGVTDGQDFVAWNANKFTGVSWRAPRQATPEPGQGMLVVIAAWLGLQARCRLLRYSRV